ncbi:MAG: DMT family transporter [Alphaproteobacteria bacterium]|nr:DMT family transporter [Alphaproteobacteria bacterium]
MNRTGLLLVILTAVGWGSNWPMLKILIGELPPLTARGTAGIAAGLMLAGLALAWGQRVAVPRAIWSRLVLSAGLNVCAWMGFATLGLMWLHASEAAILAYTAPIWTAIFAWPVLGERPNWQRGLALVLALAGVGVLFGGAQLELGMDKAPGIILVLLAGMLFGLGTVLGKRMPLGLPPITVAAWQVGLGCAPLLVIGFLFEAQPWAQLSGLAWFFLVWMAVVPLGLAYVTWFEALKRVPATVASIGTMLAPIVGVIGAAIFLDEPFGLRQVAAIALVMAGVVLSMRR